MSKLKVNDLNKRYQEMADKISSKKGIIATIKERAKAQKALSTRYTAYVIHFQGDMYAKAVEHLRDEISTIILGAKSRNVLVKLDSPGGTVTGYSLVAEQLNRLKQNGFTVTVVIDQVAASGGYMAAVVADKIIVAPNAIIGSVGVVCNIPIAAKLLDRIGIDYKEYTAGEYKRTVTPYREPEPHHEEHLNDQLQRIHGYFKDHIKKHRPNVDVELIGTGEVWSGCEAVENGMVDEIGLYDDILLEWLNTYHVFELETKTKKGFVGKFTSNIVDQVWDKFINSNSIEKMIR